MSVTGQPSAERAAATLLALPAAQRPAWLAAHQGDCTLELVAALKALSDPLGLTDPPAAAEATACALLAAERSADPLAPALAAWARGNWEIYHDPQRAISCYRQALAGYRAASDELSAARLLTNLVFPYTECGLLAEAEAAAEEARALLERCAGATKRHRMVLEQNAGWLLHSQGRYNEALAVYQRALQLAYELDDPASAAEIQVNRTITLEVFGQIAEEEVSLLASRAMAEAHGQRLTVARIDLNLGELHVAQGRPMEALRRLQAAGAAFAALDNSMELAAVLLAEAALFGWLGALREARRSYTQARDLFRALDMQPQVGVALVRGAVANRHAGADHEAAGLLAAAEALWDRLAQPAWQRVVRVEQAELLLAQGRTGAARAAVAGLLGQADLRPALAAQCRRIEADALTLDWERSTDEAAYSGAARAYEAALATARQIDDRGLQRQALAGQGRLLRRQDPGAARAALAEALALDEATRQTLTSEELIAGFQARRHDLLASLLDDTLALSRPLDALDAIWRVKGGALLEVLHRRASAPGLPKAAVGEARQRLAVMRWRRILEAQLADTPDSAAEGADAQIQAAEDGLRALLRRDQAGHAGASLQEGPGPILRALPADMLIEYARCDAELVAICAEPTGACRLVRLGDAEAVAGLLDDLQLHIQHVLTLPPGENDGELWIQECQALLQALYEALIAPLGPLPSVGRLLIAPCDPLYLVPFAALHDGERYLIEGHPLALTPCGALAAAPWHEAGAGGALILAASAEGLLGGVASEVAAVAAALPEPELLYDQPESIAAVQGRPRAPAVLHIAAHSVLREDAPLFSALQLKGELLSVEQCYDLPLRGTALVTLSGCTTGAGLETGGSLLAFQTALFAAGARAVLSSLWPINDAATGGWMARFYALLATGLTPEVALRETQLGLLGQPGRRHPAQWAAFACNLRDLAYDKVSEKRRSQ